MLGFSESGKNQNKQERKFDRFHDRKSLQDKELPKDDNY